MNGAALSPFWRGRGGGGARGRKQRGPTGRRRVSRSKFRVAVPGRVGSGLQMIASLNSVRSSLRDVLARILNDPVHYMFGMDCSGF